MARIPASLLVPVIQEWRVTGVLEVLPGSVPRICRALLAGERQWVTVDTADLILVALGCPERLNEIAPACERCGRTFVRSRTCGQRQVYCRKNCKSMAYASWRRSVDPEFRLRGNEASRLSKLRAKGAAA